ncbi:MAG: leucine--tRNA ligase [Candidatus Pacebacteria bacterium]|jgi:leucyl-tRNA synthetase|nr:leucine--tRNA ligase [Candidatus Paceibacterota bacterium]|tara:strand:- start:9079 stop:11469 length:2391 start_codon:yes stop_codon:yes gene_type:complete
MREYDHKKIEQKWQKTWEETKQNEVDESSTKPKYYSLIEFPYPSGEGLHVGHPRSYTAMDIVARKRRREGFEVLYPIGFDAFGLPAENYAVKTGVHPKITTEKAIENYRKQLKSIGFSFDWSRELKTTDPEYYKWTQWIFLKLFENNLAYKKKIPINWCKDCKIGLANEEVVGGVCERCDGTIEKKEKEQWMLAITKYAERLLDDLEPLDYIEPVKVQQKNWIGKSRGAELDFPLKDLEEKINVFTTRPDTLYGATYMVLSPEHQFIHKLEDKIENLDEVKNYIKEAATKTDIERTAEGKDKTGVELKGLKAINPTNNKEIPVFVADYVLIHYGTGAIMAVPAHDKRDYEFAKKFGLEIIEVISGGDISKEAYVDNVKGVLVNSGEFDGQSIEESQEGITKSVGGRMTVTYRLRDWVFSRQRYWGEPIPMILCSKCGPVPVPEEELPVELPEVEDFMPSETGESPLSKAENWVNVKCPQCGEEAKRETDVMPNWAGSSWYFLRYLDPENNKVLVDKEKADKWMPVDWYNGGMEHTTLHLLYSRFWYKFLFDIGVVITPEPYKKRTSHGLILGEDNEKMSKSRGNVINPNDIVDRFGADTFRVYEMFMGPFDQAIAWSNDGLMGPRRFLEKIWRASEKVSDIRMSSELESLMHETVEKVGEDIEEMKFNTAVSSMMIYFNQIEKEEDIPREAFRTLLLLLAPFTPHITEELWEKLKEKESIHLTPWPAYDKNKVAKNRHLVVIQVNGKVRGEFETEESNEEKIKEVALSQERVRGHVQGKEIKRVIYVKNKLINIVI